MGLDLLKPANGQPKKPSEIRNNLQHLLGAALPDCILPEADGGFGGKFAAGDGLTVSYSGFKGIIGGKYHEAAAGTKTGLAARRAQLMYAGKNADSDALMPAIGVVEAAFPAADAGTVGRWIIDGAATVASTAGSNDLTKVGTVAQVEGWIGYGGKGDGSTGYYVSANSTGFPTGTTAVELFCVFTVNGVSWSGSNARAIVGFGSGAGGVLIIAKDGARIKVSNGSVMADTGYDVEVGKTYNVSVQLISNVVSVFINGVLVYSGSLAVSLVAGAFYAYRHASFANSYNEDAIYYMELRNALRTPAQIAAISNALLLPCRYEIPGNTDISVSAQAISSGDYSSYLKGNAFNNDGVSSKWISSQVDAAVNGTSYIGQNFGYVVPIKGFTIIQDNVTSGSWQSSVKAQYTDDGGDTWKDIGIFVIQTGTNVAQTVNFPSTVNCQKIRLLAQNNCSGGNGWWVYEVEFFTPPTTPSIDIRSILPADSVVLGFVRTDSSGVIEINDSDYKYGRREGALGGNRKVFLGWKYFSGSTTLYWDNPFDTRKINTCFTWARDANGTNETPCTSVFSSGSTYGVYLNNGANKLLALVLGGGGVCNFSGAWQTSGYIGCYAEVIE